MNILFYISGLAAVAATTMVIVGNNAVHSLLYLIVSFLSVSVIFFLLGAPFIAALEVIIYAGAIMVLFVFVIMMLNVGGPATRENELLRPRAWVGPSLIALVLLGEMIFIIAHQSSGSLLPKQISPGEVGELLFTKYILMVELSAFLLTSGVIGAFHLGEKEMVSHHRYLKNNNQPS